MKMITIKNIYGEKLQNLFLIRAQIHVKLKTKQDKIQVHNEIKHEATGICNSSGKI
jgi:hypothetical protein